MRLSGHLKVAAVMWGKYLIMEETAAQSAPAQTQPLGLRDFFLSFNITQIRTRAHTHTHTHTHTQLYNFSFSSNSKKILD